MNNNTRLPESRHICVLCNIDDVGDNAVYYASYRDVHAKCLEYFIYNGVESDQIVKPEQYLLVLDEYNIPTLIKRPPPSKEALKCYLATHLSLSTKYIRKEKLKFFLQYMGEATSQNILTKKDVYEILHIRKAGHEMFDTVLNNCVKNNDEESATEIIKLEKEVHNYDENKLSLLQCVRLNLDDEELKQWIVRQIYNEDDNDCLGKIGINREIKMWISISFGTFLFSMGTYAMDQERQILKREYENSYITVFH